MLIPSQILYEDKYIVAVSKPHGMVTEYDPRFEPTLEPEVLLYLKANERYPHKCFIGAPHRLDRPVSGVVLFAKKRSILKILGEMFAARAIQKEYFAIVEKKPLQSEAELIHYLEKDQKNRKAIVHTQEAPHTLQAVLSYSVVSEGITSTLLRVKPVTGKFHQIRAQLAFIGCPIVGDALYGGKIPYKENGIALHACKLELKHPVTQEVLQITAPLPDDEVWGKF